MSHYRGGGNTRDLYDNSNRDGVHDFSDRTPKLRNTGIDRSIRSQYSQYDSGGTYNQYQYDTNNEGETLDDSNRTPYSQSQGTFMTEAGGYDDDQGGFGAYYGEENALDNSDRTPYSYQSERSSHYQNSDMRLNQSERSGYSQFSSANQSAYASHQSGYNSSKTGTTSHHKGAQLDQSGRTGNSQSYGNSSRRSYPSQSRASSNQQYNVSYNASGAQQQRRDSKFSEVSSVSGFSTHSSSLYSAQQQHNRDNSSVRTGHTGGTPGADRGKRQTTYQIEFRVQNQGQKIAGSKRIIHFRFGFANGAALSKGMRGTDCRGEEHDIVAQWSITGGKRTIIMDGREIQYSVGKRANASRRADILEASWRLGTHVYELRCYAYKPSAASHEKRDKRWQQYTLIIDGTHSYFDLPQIFDLGERVLAPAYGNLNAQPTMVNSNDPTTRSLSSTQCAKPQQLKQSKEVKNAIQSRIDQQRKLMKARKKASKEIKRASRPNSNQHALSAPAPAEEETDMGTIGFESMGINESERTGGLQSSVFSEAPTELLDRSERPGEAAEYGRETGYEGTEYNESSKVGLDDLLELDDSGRTGLDDSNLFSTAPDELAQARNRAPAPSQTASAAHSVSTNNGHNETQLVPAQWKPPSASDQQLGWNHPSSQKQQPYVSPMERQKQQRQTRLLEDQPSHPNPRSGQQAESTTRVGQPKSPTKQHRQLEYVQQSSTSQPPTMEEITKSIEPSPGVNKFAFF